MKGNLFLSEAVNLDDIKKGYLNVIKAPTGSGKTYFALNCLPAKCDDVRHKFVYLIDTRNGKEQIIKNYGAVPATRVWKREVEEGDAWTVDDGRITIMTYALFGVFSLEDSSFCDNFDFIICDELHSLPKFEKIKDKKKPKPNGIDYHIIARFAIERAVLNQKTTVIALSATPNRIISQIHAPHNELPIDYTNVREYTYEEEEYFEDIDYVLNNLPSSGVGMLYTIKITNMIEIADKVRKLGKNPICIWSDKSEDHPMDESQINARRSILDKFEIPSQYDFLIINVASETSIKIKSPVDYLIINSNDKDTQTQVIGRINHDFKKLYRKPSNRKQIKIELPDTFLYRKLYAEDKEKLLGYIKTTYGFEYSWKTCKVVIENNLYKVASGQETAGPRRKQRFAIIEDECDV